MSKPSSSRSAIPTDLSHPADPWFYERLHRKQGHERIAGVDEAGRGPLAGPVVAACVILPPEFDGSGVTDSKRLTSRQREFAYCRIIQEAIMFAVGIVESPEIDQINILRATHVAMRKAIEQLPCVPDVLLIDGLPVPLLAACSHFAIVGGDGLSISIAAASILAKVTRDRIMCDYATVYPHYGFDKHKGYGSAEHLAALQVHGPCPIHRRSFAPVSILIQPTLL